MKRVVSPLGNEKYISIRCQEICNVALCKTSRFINEMNRIFFFSFDDFMHFQSKKRYEFKKILRIENERV